MIITDRISKFNVVISSAVILASLIIWQDSKISLSAALGSVIGGGNFVAIAGLGRRIFGDGPRSVWFALALLLKFAVLIFVLWAIIKWLPIEPAAFLVGLSIIIIAIILVTILSNHRTIELSH